MGERRILRGTTPTLVGYPRLRPGELVQGAPTSPKAKVATSSTPLPSAFVACGSDTLSATVNGALGAGVSAIVVDAPASTWVRDRLYLVTSADDVFVVQSKTSGSSLTLRTVEPLPGAVADAATVDGFALTRDLTAAETDEVGDGIVQWQAVVGGETVEWTDSFRVVRRIPKATLTPSRLLMLEPTMSSLQLSTDVTHERVIAGAWERLQVTLERNQVFDEDVVSDEAIVPLHAAQCVLLVVEKDPRYDRAFVEDLRTSFRTLQDSVFSRKSYDEQGQLIAVAPRVAGVREERGRGIRIGR